MQITLTPKAASKLKAILAKEGKPGGCLRLKVVSGGCSGLSYDLEIAEAPKPTDKLFETEGAVLAVDARAEKFVKGSTVDYVQSLMKSGFEIKNPLASSSCSCGESFSVEPETFSV